MPDDDLDRLSRRAEELGRAVEAARARETTGTSSDGAVAATARGGRLVDVTLPPRALATGNAAGAHRELVAGIHEAASTALRESYRVMQDASEIVTADLFPRPGGDVAS